MCTTKLKYRPESFLGPKQGSKDAIRRKKRVPSPTHSLEEFNSGTDKKIDSLKAPKIRRNPSWPAVLVSPNSSTSDSEETNFGKSKSYPKACYRKYKKSFSTTKLKPNHRRHTKSRSRSQLESSNSLSTSKTDYNISKPMSDWFNSSSRSSSSESFLSTNDDENTIIAQSMPKKHNSSQSLFTQNFDLFNYTSDSDSLAQDKHTIASISDTALDKHNFSTHRYN